MPAARKPTPLVLKCATGLGAHVVAFTVPGCHCEWCARAADYLDAGRGK